MTTIAQIQPCIVLVTICTILKLVSMFTISTKYVQCVLSGPRSLNDSHLINHICKMCVQEEYASHSLWRFPGSPSLESLKKSSDAFEKTQTPELSSFLPMKTISGMNCFVYQEKKKKKQKQGHCGQRSNTHRVDLWDGMLTLSVTTSVSSSLQATSACC